ncbi:hypothetical protein EJ110_NYTH32732 [Nymphaea thermarum]|nr:hypothetical protein EJ110_NYTH32732 [Nymphaea thermarum]
MKLVADLDGVTSIVLDPSKSTATVVGETDPALIIKRIRKFRKCAELVSVGPPKDETKLTYPIMPNCCQRCDSWFVVQRVEQILQALANKERSNGFGVPQHFMVYYGITGTEWNILFRGRFSSH